MFSRRAWPPCPATLVSQVVRTRRASPPAQRLHDLENLVLQIDQLLLDAAVFLFGEMVFGVLGEIAQRRRLADAVLHVDLRFVKLLALSLHRRFFLGTHKLHDATPVPGCSVRTIYPRAA